ncbi:Rab family GTPase [Legionella rowbothamii]|uniref:Rab family GTPase n=1 Tax=Legionella rowbothamii TaxID=96229 RepID=UPI001054DDE2|nr:GTPase domain-containing protein [Legionella rowbothamii]
MTKKVFIFGASGTGKTELLRQLIDQGVTRGADYHPTIGPDFQLVNGLMIWDSTGTNSEYKESSRHFRIGAELGIYCINLSKVIDNDVLQQIKLDLISFSALNPDAKLILVGTCSDEALPENTMESLCNQLQEPNFMAVVAVTTASPRGTQPLLRVLNHYVNLNNLLILRNKFPNDSDLYSALNKLNNEVIHLGLNADEIDALGNEVSNLLVAITDSTLLDKTKAYNQFLVNCDAKFTEMYHGLKAAVKTFAAVVLVTALAAGLFFGAGVVFGAWAGASAFFTALVEGTTGAAAFAAGTTATNLTSIAYFGSSFFQKPVKSAASEFIESVKNANIEDLNLSGTM